MSDEVRIIVDGQNGSDVAWNGFGIRHVDYGDTNPNTALVRRGETRDGQHGRRASRAIRGSPAGFVAVKLSESDEHHGGLHVVVLDYASIQQPPLSAEVPAQRDLVLSAAGGNGESGHVGGNGEPGMNGNQGAAATRESDATPGTNAGRGGEYGPLPIKHELSNAGEGTNGADGGDGGTVQISVDEHNMHLLLATTWDVRGGRGGEPGRHGEPGRGGIGGEGGSGHTWSELVGFQYHCTKNCVGNSTSTSSTALVGAGSRFESRMKALTASTRAEVVQGGNLQAMIARVAAQYGAMRHPFISPGACCCAGGNGNCAGCRSTPIHKEFSRSRALDGRNGEPSARVMTALFPGAVGQNGSVNIVVQSEDGSVQDYSSLYKLELLDFEVEDENGDGIFEPGEHVLIRRIRVKNSGGMPSPKCQIPVTAISSIWFSRVSGEQGRIFIPNSIPPGVTVTLEGTIMILIKQCDDPPPIGNLFFEHDNLRIMAVMPWLNRVLPNFGFSKTIDIQFPIELRNIDYLPSLAQGIRSNLSWEVYNKSVKPLGGSTESDRSIEVDISVDSRSASLLSPTQEWASNVINEVDILPDGSAVPTKQMLRISEDAQNYQELVLRVLLYLAIPSRDPSAGDAALVPVQVIQQEELRIQVSSAYTYNPRAEVLLVTNPATDIHRYQAIQTFLHDNLGTEMDEWNVGLYGGLQYTAEEGEIIGESVLSTYSGKIIIFLGNRFDFLKTKDRSILQFCDPNVLAQTCAQGTSCLFLGSAGDPSYVKLLQDLLMPIPHEMNIAAKMPIGSTTFGKMSNLVKSISQQILVESAKFSLYKIPVKTRWYRFGTANQKAEAKTLVKHLHRNLPQERFLVTAEIPEPLVSTNRSEQQKNDEGIYTGEDNMTSSEKGKNRKPLGNLIILHGSAKHVSLRATESQTLVTTREGTDSGARDGVPSVSYRLNDYEAFMCVASYPTRKLIELAWSGHTNDGGDDIGYPFTRLQAVVLSLQTEIYKEIQAILLETGSINKLPRAGMISDPGPFLRLHLPILAALLQHREANSATTLPEHMVGLLQHIEASCFPQSKRQIAKAATLTLYRRQIKLRKLVMAAIAALLKRKLSMAADIRRFHQEARSLHSYVHSDRRNTQNATVRRASELTKVSEHAFTEGHKTSRELFPVTDYCSAEEWDRRWKAREETRARMRTEVREAQEALKRMILGSSSGDRADGVAGLRSSELAA
ncbi:hypothetical protein MMC17_004922 [Xylographa soralifera]|nr:hypothetical protein [Xylographa soralifera]